MTRCAGWLMLGWLGSSAAWGQEQPAPDVNTLETFLLQVAQHTNSAAAVALNGQPTTLTRPSIKDTLEFLTEDEVQALRSIAGDLGNKTVPLTADLKRLVLEERLAAIASETPARAVSSQLEELNRQHSQIVRDHVERLRAALGDSQFRMVESYINSKKGSGAFFPLVPSGTKRPTAAKAKSKAVSR
jgi:hypothetical protein